MPRKQEPVAIPRLSAHIELHMPVVRRDALSGVSEKNMPGWTQILLVVAIIVLLFGSGRISGLMGDFAKGIRSFREGLNDGDEEDDNKPEPKTIDATAVHEDEAEKKADKDKTASS